VSKDVGNGFIFTLMRHREKDATCPPFALPCKENSICFLFLIEKFPQLQSHFSFPPKKKYFQIIIIGCMTCLNHEIYSCVAG